MEELQDLCEIRSNRFEALIGKRKGQYGIRINKQWRLCFRWSSDGPEDVEVVDYHSAIPGQLEMPVGSMT